LLEDNQPVINVCVSVTGRWMWRVVTASQVWNTTQRVQCFQSSSHSQMKDSISSVWYYCLIIVSFRWIWGQCVV